MARHVSNMDNTWIYWVIGIGAVWYLSSTGILTNLFSSITNQFQSLVAPTTTSALPNAQGQVPTTPMPGITQVEPTAVYQNDVNISSVNQYG